ncbi:MAG: type II secretion system F family protein [Candidatus Omnitrophica bacterium]|nr:type II secretion system F family protein [Candidatus Omnitrophota bacterium]
MNLNILLLLQIAIFIFGGSSVYLISQVLIPVLAKRYEELHRKRAAHASSSLENMFIWVSEKKLILVFGLTPIILGIVFFIWSGKPLLTGAGFALGFILPMFVIRILEKKRKKKFHSQLPDALTSLTQSLKAGLSFLQALEVITEELSPPISQEFALVVKEYKMGVELKQSFESLNKRMGSEELNLMTTGILVASETGGSLTEIFEHLNESIRKKNRISEQLKTLTTQARWQGRILSALPIVFAVLIFKINPDFFSQMVQSDIGRLLLVWCLISELIGAIMLNRLSRIEI